MGVEQQQRRARRRLTRTGGRAFWLRTVLIAVLDALAVVAALALVAEQSYTLLVLLAISLGLVNWAYLNPRAVASRWLTPGIVLMLVFVVYPVLYTSYVSITNWQTGNVLTKEQAIEKIEAKQVSSDAAEDQYSMSVYRDDSGGLALLVTGDGIRSQLAVVREIGTPSVADSTVAVDVDPAEPPSAIGDYELLPKLAVTGAASTLERSAVDLLDGREARVETLSTVKVRSVAQRFVYDPDTDTLADNQTGRVCTSGPGVFVCDGVPEVEVAAVARISADSTIDCRSGICDEVPLFAIDASLPGWRTVTGFGNYAEIFDNERIREPFLRVLVWNVVFALLSVMMTFALGLALAFALKNESIRGRSIYRSIYILPYAIPGFLSVLVWRGLLNAEYGKVNGVVEAFGFDGVDWIGSTRWAPVAVLLVNLWLGFPYMFLISSGALTSIPDELLEAARVDGASPLRTFRSIILPLLLVSTAPLLIGSFAFNFNNFMLIFLLTGGGPPLTGYDVPVGGTDLLISFTFDLAQSAGRGNQFGLASAIVVLIFLFLATVSAFSFRLTKKLEEIYDQ
ncbi:MAG: ABC transporter permease subunit [Ilumatobacteraceae bacterium]